MTFNQYVTENRGTMRFGQMFCNYFGITDPILFYDESTANAIQYSGEKYPEKWASIYENKG